MVNVHRICYCCLWGRHSCIGFYGWIINSSINSNRKEGKKTGMVRWRKLGGMKEFINGLLIWDFFQGYTPSPDRTESCAVRFVLILAGFLFLYLGYRRILEPFLMIPMGIGMLRSYGVLVLEAGQAGNLSLTTGERPRPANRICR